MPYPDDLPLACKFGLLLKQTKTDATIKYYSPAPKAGFWAEPFFSHIAFFSIDSGSQGYPLRKSAGCQAGTLGQFEILIHLCNPPWYMYKKWTNWAFSSFG